MKKYAIGIACMFLFLLVLIFIFWRSVQVKEVYTAQLASGYSIHVQWVDDRYVVTTSSSQVSLWDMVEGTQVLTYTLTVPVHYDNDVSVLRTSITTYVAMLGNGVLQVWNLFDPDPFFVWNSPRESSCDDWVLYQNTLGTPVHKEEILVGCRNWSFDTQTVYRVNIATAEVMTYFDQPWKAVDPYADTTVFGFDKEFSRIYAMNLDTQQFIWSTSIEDHPSITFSGINEAAMLGCGESTCFLLDRKTGALQQTFHVDGDVKHAYFFNENVIILHRGGMKRVGLDVRSVRTGTQVHHTYIELPPSSSWYDISADLSVQGYLAVSFFQESDSGAELQWTPVYMYDVATLNRIAILNAHTDAVFYLVFDPTGTYLFTGSYDKTFKIWEIEK